MHNKLPLLIALPDSFLIAESRIPHRIGITGIKLRQMESNGLYKKGYRQDLCAKRFADPD